jgi:hypothetical protein
MDHCQRISRRVVITSVALSLGAATAAIRLAAILVASACRITSVLL